MKTSTFFHKSILAKIAGITLIAGLLLSLVTAILPTATLAQGDPWTCDGTIYVTTGDGAGHTTLSSVDMSSSPWTLMTLLQFDLNLNALAYNPVDNFMYSTDPNNGNVYRIGQSGAQLLGVPTGGGWPGGEDWYAATFVYTPGSPPTNPIYVVVRDSDPYPIVRLDVSTTPPTILSQGNLGDTYYDIAFNPIDGLIYAVREDGYDRWILPDVPDHTYVIDPDNFDETELGSAGRNGTWAAAFADVTGRVFFYDISDGFYEANLVSGALGRVSDAATVARADGANCPQAELPVPEYDYGDLPDDVTTPLYPTLTDNGGARHVILEGAPKLGSTIDKEVDGQPNTAADLDDTTGSPDDEDGVARAIGKGGAANGGWTNGTVASGEGGALEITVGQVAGVVQVWMDFNNDGALTEVILLDAAGANIAQPMAVGTHTVYFDVPAGTFVAATADIYSRVRISTAGQLQSGGDAADGEVEDYLMKFGPNAISLKAFTAEQSLPSGLLVGFALAILVLVTGAGWFLRRQRN